VKCILNCSLNFHCRSEMSVPIDAFESHESQQDTRDWCVHRLFSSIHSTRLAQGWPGRQLYVAFKLV
jgi:hypothetical protein